MHGGHRQVPSRRWTQFSCSFPHSTQRCSCFAMSSPNVLGTSRTCGLTLRRRPLSPAELREPEVHDEGVEPSAFRISDGRAAVAPVVRQGRWELNPGITVSETAALDHFATSHQGWHSSIRTMLFGVKDRGPTPGPSARKALPLGFEPRPSALTVRRNASFARADQPAEPKGVEPSSRRRQRRRRPLAYGSGVRSVGIGPTLFLVGNEMPCH